MEGDRAEFNDWEVLHNSDAAMVHSSGTTDNNPRNFDEIEGDSEGMIRSDYFSLDNQGRVAAETVVEADASEDGSVESDNPSWIDPAVPEPHYGRMNPGEFWSDSASDRSEDRKSSDFDPKKELSLLENAKSQVELGEIQALDHSSREFWSDTGGDAAGCKEFGGGEAGKLSGKVTSGDSITEAEGVKSAAKERESNDLVVEEAEKNPIAKKNVSEGDKRPVAWWKIPLEVLKYCAFRVSPVWTFSVAAAVLGMVMLGRRLYRMKRKTQSLQLKVTMDDKVSLSITQFILYLFIFLYVCDKLFHFA